MGKIRIADITLYANKGGLSFKDKIDVVRLLDNLRADVIYMPKIENVVTDSLLIRTVASFVKNSTLCAVIDSGDVDIESIFSALKEAKNKRLCIALPVSDFQMEYFLHKKAPKMLELIKNLVETAKSFTDDVEFFALDATRADKAFLNEVVTSAINSGANTITFSDDEGIMLLDDFRNFFNELYNSVSALKDVNVGVCCKNSYKMAVSSSMISLQNGANEIKCAVANGEYLSVEDFVNVIKNCESKLNFKSDVNFTEFYRISKQISRILGAETISKDNDYGVINEKNTEFSINDSKKVVLDAVKKLGYDVNSEDAERIFEEFKLVAEKKTVTSKDLDAIVGNVASQVPPVYKLVSFIINNGNIIQSSAQITVVKDGKEYSAISMGDGPIDASFRALEQILGHKYELDDFQIQAVTEGKEAIGSAIVRLRSNGKLYSANGISTDIIGASIYAYINAVNKIVYEEEN